MTGNIENDADELARQMESSWAHKQGIPSKSGQLMQFGVTLANHERVATNLMVEAMNKINTKIKTKGRYQVEIATNG